MPETEFHTRSEALSESPVASDARSAPDWTAPARDRHERLRRALDILERRGGTGPNRGYAPAFRSLAKAGIIVKPLPFCSFLELTAFAFVILVVLIGVPAMLSLLTPYPPRIALRMVEAGPAVFLAIKAALAIFFAALYRKEIRKLGLPAWRDL